MLIMKPFNLGAPCGYAYTGLVERLGLPEELRQNLSLFIIIRKKKEKNVGEESEGLESNPTKKSFFSAVPRKYIQHFNFGESKKNTRTHTHFNFGGLLAKQSAGEAGWNIGT